MPRRAKKGDARGVTIGFYITRKQQRLVQLIGEKRDATNSQVIATLIDREAKRLNLEAVYDAETEATT